MAGVQSYPMLLLALDTTTAAGSVALWRDGLIEERAGDPGRSHAERLPGDLMAILGAHGLAPRDVERYAVAAGPARSPACGSASPPFRASRWSATGSCTRSGRSSSWRTTPPERATPAPARPSSRGWRHTAAKCSRRATASCRRRRTSPPTSRRSCPRRGDPRRARSADGVGAGAAGPRLGGERRRSRHRHRRRRPADAADPPRVLRRGRGAARAGAAGRHAGGPRRGASTAPRPARTPSCPSTCGVPTPSSPAIAPPCVRRRERGQRDVRAARSRPCRADPRPGRDPRRRRGDVRSSVDPRDVRMGVDPLRRGAVLRRPEPGAGSFAYCAGWIIFDELHINNLAVDPPWRRRGVASALLTFVLAGGRRRGRHPRDAGGPAVERAGPAPLRTVRLRLCRRADRLLPGAGRGRARPLAERAGSVVKPEIRRPHRP